jgi:hypothetical protein
MAILQSIFGVGVLGIIGFIIYWVGIVLGVGPEVEEEAVDESTKI